MALESNALASLVFIDHVSAFPASATVTRVNLATGVPLHNPAFAFIQGLCDAVAIVLKTLPIYDLGVGTVDVPGIPVPVPVVFPGIPVAIAQMIAELGMLGPSGAVAASIFVGSTLLNVSKISLLQMGVNPLMGTGAGVVSPASNPGLLAQATAALQAQLPLSFQATGKFGVGDVPSAPVNAQLLRQLPLYAAALGTGIASLTAAVPYVGTAAAPTPIAGALNSGAIV